MKPSNTKPKLKIEFADTQNIQVIHDKLHKVNQILELNLRIFQVISSLMNAIPTVEGQQPSKQFPSKDGGLVFCTAETEIQLKRLNTLFQRINAASGLVLF